MLCTCEYQIMGQVSEYQIVGPQHRLTFYIFKIDVQSFFKREHQQDALIEFHQQRIILCETPPWPRSLHKGTRENLGNDNFKLVPCSIWTPALNCVPKNDKTVVLSKTKTIFFLFRVNRVKISFCRLTNRSHRTTSPPFASVGIWQQERSEIIAVDQDNHTTPSWVAILVYLRKKNLKKIQKPGPN